MKGHANLSPCKVPVSMWKLHRYSHECLFLCVENAQHMWNTFEIHQHNQSWNRRMEWVRKNQDSSVFPFLPPLPAQNGTHCQKRLKEVCRLVLQTHPEWKFWNGEQRQSEKKVLSDPLKIRGKKDTPYSCDWEVFLTECKLIRLMLEHSARVSGLEFGQICASESFCKHTLHLGLSKLPPLSPIVLYKQKDSFEPLHTLYSSQCCRYTPALTPQPENTWIVTCPSTGRGD